jgi:hypothetical protein
MIRTTRASLTSTIALLLACLTCGVMLSGAAGALAAEPVIVYKMESLQGFEKQLAAGQIQSVTINKRVASLHVTLKNGEHWLAHYGKHEEPKQAAALKAKGVPVTVETPAVAIAEVKKPHHHKLRYIAAGVVIVVIILVGGVLLIDRRRKLAAD